MIRRNLRLFVCATIICSFSPTYTYATNGYFLIGFGAKSRGMGGVGVAHGVDGLAAASNPATMSDVSTRFDIGADLFSVPRGVTHSDGRLSQTTIIEESGSENTAFSHNDLFLIPNMGGVYTYSDKITYGFAFIGAGAASRYDQTLPAGNTDYFFNFNDLAGPAKSGDPDNVVGVKLLQLQIPLSVAYKVNKQQSVGASFVVAAQFFEALGLHAFEQLNFGATTSNLTNQGTDHSYGAGIRLGWTGDFMEEGKLRVGANYSSRVYMTEFERYKNLFAEQGDFDIPSNWAVGMAYHADDNTSIKVDFQRINYSEVASVGNPGPYAYNDAEFNPLCPGDDTLDCKLGGDNGMGFGWIDQNIIKLGIEHQYKPNLTLRAGLNHGSGVIPNDQVLFNMLAPATVEDHATLGATYTYSKDIELSASYVHGFKNTVTGPTLFQPLGSDPNLTLDNASITMKQRALGFSLGIKW